jgi:hypothetical protein
VETKQNKMNIQISIKHNRMLCELVEGKLRYTVAVSKENETVSQFMKRISRKVEDTIQGFITFNGASFAS